MATYCPTLREIPLDDGWDVIVVGGGPAGCTAATAASREGARTLLVERSGVLGGMGTAGLVPWFCGYADGEKVIARGLAEVVRQRLHEGMAWFQGKQPAGWDDTDPAIDPELLKRIYDEMVTGAGATIRFCSSLCGVECDGENQPETLLVSDKSGLTALRGKILVDCTGDADLAAWAGAEIHKGDAEGGLQPATHCFVMANINEEALPHGPQIHFSDKASPVWKGIASADYPLVVDLHSCSRRIGPGLIGFNTGHLFEVDNTDPASLSQALLDGRQMVRQYAELFREHIPAFNRAYLAATGSQLGIRETRRVQGDYLLTVDDYLASRSFADEICRNAYNIDVHGSREESASMTELTPDEVMASIKKATQDRRPGQSLGVPYRCLTPKGLRNTLVAGRSISADRQVNGSVRIMACCLTTGEAAGTAAAMAAAGDGDVHRVDTAELRRKLRAAGAYLPEGDAPSMA